MPASTYISRLFFSVLTISLLGTLPPGVLNVTVLRTAASEGSGDALAFATGAVAVEMLFAVVTLSLLRQLEVRTGLFLRLEILSLMVLSIYGGQLLWKAGGSPPITPMVTQPDPLPLLNGMMLSAVNPVQIPFWFGWSVILRNRGLLKAGMKDWKPYVTGIGLGSMLGFLPFLGAGILIWSDSEPNLAMLNYVSGTALVVVAIWQWILLFRKLRPAKG
jgi:threonine/homoserine/homoserine lactone efflux protein